ncbi:hypothetical protein ND748_11280 [Frankia sp. AiPs1]|uniref:hypothetical protein n=1 Tax=Frankia sp. AiPs1 TaxID=573493 RepID=UPI0020443B0C|nr:hypothetical protein [Frankia sp. AiPs1]MCM3922236.1 hypothetical protein [Frankia sp. AiPs1]
MNQPNHQLRSARERTESPHARGESLSRRELAELVNAAVSSTTGRTVVIDDHYIGKLERGVIRWPQENYRAALRAILRVPSDAELGFRRPRRPHPSPADETIPSAALTAPGTAPPSGFLLAEAADQQLRSTTTPAGNIPADLALLEEWSAMLRRELLMQGAATLTALTHLESYLSALDADPATKVAVLRSMITAQRRREGLMPAPGLAGIVVEHMRLLRAVGEHAREPRAQRLAAEALSEGYGFLAWLAWDMWEIGSAQRYYHAAVRMARQSQHPTLTAYMLGSTAVFTAKSGNPHRALDLIHQARKSLPAHTQDTIEAWLYSTSAAAHASAQQADETWRYLDMAHEATTRIRVDDNPPWPWIMRFDDQKLAGYRLVAAVDLHNPTVALRSAPLATKVQVHSAQHALNLLAQADAHAMNRDYDQSAAIALTALDAASTKTSQRVIRAAWKTRQALPVTSRDESVQRLDDKLRNLDPLDI